MFHKSDFFFSLFDGLSLMGGIAFAFYYYLLGRYANRFDTARWVFISWRQWQLSVRLSL